MQWGSSNLKTQGQPNVLAGVEARPSQRKYKQDIKTKKKRLKEEEIIDLEEYSDQKKEKETSPKRERNGRRS